MKITSCFIIIFLINVLSLEAYSQRDISFYLSKAEQNNPVIQQNQKLAEINRLQNDLIYAQNIKPQVYLSSDYLFAPYFNNYGRVISITPNPSPDAVGYDPSVSNGGLYQALINLDIPLLNGSVTRSLINRNNLQNVILRLSTNQIVHDLEKTIKEQYTNLYSVQELIKYTGKIIGLIENRKKIVTAFAEKGLVQQTDYLLLEIEQNSRVIESHQQMQMLTDEFTKLNILCGIDDTTKYELAEPEVIQNLPVSSYKLNEKYKADSLTIAAQEDVLNKSFLPQLNLYFNAGLESTDAANIPHNFGTGIGLHLNIPLYNGNQKNISVQQNKISYDTLSISYNSQILIIKSNLKSLNNQINTFSETLTLYESQIKQQELLLEILQAKLVSGQVSTVEYLKATEDYELTNQNLLNAKISLMKLINQYNYLNW